MEELNEINQTLRELCTLLAAKTEEDDRHEQSLRELDEAMESIRARRRERKTFYKPKRKI